MIVREVVASDHCPPWWIYLGYNLARAGQLAQARRTYRRWRELLPRF